MSNEKQEKIADIVADIRAQNQGLPEDSYALSPLVCDLLSFADRIEAAHQREVGELCGERNGILNANASLAADNDRLRREVAELRECLRMAVVNARIARTCCAFGRECDSCGQSCDARKWNKVIEATKGAGDGFKRD